MNVEFTLSIQEDNEALVMEKAPKIPKLVKQLGSKIDKLELDSEIEHLMGDFSRAEAFFKNARNPRRDYGWGYFENMIGQMLV